MSHDASMDADPHVAERLVRPPHEDPSLPAPATEFDRFYSRYASYRDRIRFETTDLRGRCEAFGIEPGLLMLVVDVGLTRTFQSRLKGQDIVEFHYRNSGSLAMGGRWGQLGLRDQSLLVWYQPSGCSDVEEVIGDRAAPHESWISLYCDRRWLCSTLGVDLLETLGLPAEDSPRDACTQPLYRVYPQFGATGTIVGDILRNRYRQPVNYLYAKGKALELLCSTVRALQTANPRGCASIRLSAHDRRMMNEARSILQREFVSPPDVPALARRIGTSSTKLCSGFKAQFGETTSEFVRRQRLERAYDLLHGTELQVRQVAWRVGYQHHSTFTAAFVRHFGRAPKAIARNRRDVAN